MGRPPVRAFFCTKLHARAKCSRIRCHLARDTNNVGNKRARYYAAAPCAMRFNKNTGEGGGTAVSGGIIKLGACGIFLGVCKAPQLKQP